MYVRTGLGLGDVSDPSQVLSDTIEQAKNRLMGAGGFAVLILLGVGWLVFRKKR